MNELIQKSCLWLVAIGINYCITKFVNRRTQAFKMMNPFVVRPKTTTFQTCVSRYSDTPKSFLFDISNTGSKMNDIKDTISKLNTKHHQMEIKETSSSIIELIVKSKNSENELMVNKVISTLKEKGLYLKNEALWLKPTMTLLRKPSCIYWNVKIFDLSTKDFQTEDELKIRIIPYLKEALLSTQEQKPPLLIFKQEDTISFDENQIYFQYHENKSVSMHLLLQINHQMSTIINPSRQLIYISFNDKFLPIQFSLVE